MGIGCLFLRMKGEKDLVHPLFVWPAIPFMLGSEKHVLPSPHLFSILPSLQQDIILPHHITFHDLVLNKARGKSGPLFDFSAREDIRMQVGQGRGTQQAKKKRISSFINGHLQYS